jgi:hypothetical protein
VQKLQQLIPLRDAMRDLLVFDTRKLMTDPAREPFALQRFDALLNDQALARMAALADESADTTAMSMLARIFFHELRFAWAVVDMGLQSPELLGNYVRATAPEARH